MTGKQIATAVIALLFAVTPYLGVPAWTPALATMVACMAISLIGLNLIFGVTGMLALGQAAFAALPAYIAGMGQNVGFSWAVAIPAGIAAAAIIARIVAEIFIRLPGIYFAIGTLGFAFVTEGLARAFPAVTGGASGLVLVLPFQLGPDAWYILASSCLAVGVIAYARMVRGPFLRVLRLVRHDELSAEVLGIDVARVKARVFTIGSTYSAVGGILLAYFTGILVPENGGVNQSLEQLATVIIGGAGTALGPVAGTAAVQWLFAISGSADRYELLIYGLVFFLVVLFAPAGLTGLLGRLRDLAAGFVRRAEPAPVDSGNATRASGSSLVSSDSHPGREGACLVVKNVSKRFGGLIAVDQVDLDVGYGRIVALIGPNGAGKSTLFNIINGIERPDEGCILLGGRDIAAVPIHERAVTTGRSFQVPRLVPEMTALHNIAARLDHLPGSRSENERLALARRQLARFGLAELAHRPVREIGIGYHKLIDIARASAGEPSLLLLDEPAVGLAQDEVEHLGEMLMLLKRHGAAILLVEHNFSFVTSVADRIVVLDSGRRIAAGSAEDVIGSPLVQEAYFGALT